MGSLIGIDARTSDQIQAIILSVEAAPKNIQQNIKKYTQQDIVPAWTDELQLSAPTALQQALLVNTARAEVSTTNISLRSGGLNAKVSGGLSTDLINPRSAGGDPHSYKAAEFGANRQAQSSAYTSTSKKGKRFVVRLRHTQRQFPPANSKGYVVYPAARRVIPRIAALWGATVVRTLHDAFEGKLR